MILEQFGEEEGQGQGYKVIKYFSTNSYSFTYGIKNLTDNILEGNMDFSKSQNLIFS